jgi:hypothetical protein
MSRFMMPTGAARGRRATSVAGALFVIGAILLAALIGMALPVLPVRMSVIGVGMILLFGGVVLVMLIPDRRTVPYRLIFAVFFVAVFTRFLWPNFAYIPVPVLPTKNPQRLLWFLAIVYWLYALGTNRELRERLAQRCSESAIVWLIVGLFAWRLVSLVFAEHPAFSIMPTVFEAFEYLPAVLFALTWIRDEQDALRVCRWLMLATLVILGITVAEVALQQNVFLRLIPFDPNNEEFLQTSLESKVRGGQYRSQASFNHPLLLSQFLAVVMPLIALCARFDPSRAMRRLAILALCGLPFMLWAARTRTGVIVAILVAGALLLGAVLQRLSRRKPATTRGLDGGMAAGMALLVLLAASVAAIAVIVQLTLGRTAEEVTSSYARVEMLQRALVATADSPLVGFGPDQGSILAANTNSRGRSSLDSFYLALMLDSGVPALLLFGALVAAATFRARLLITGTGLREAAQAAWALAAIGFAISAAVLGTRHNMSLFYLALGILVALSPALTQRAAEHRTQALRTPA